MHLLKSFDLILILVAATYSFAEAGEVKLPSKVLLDSLNEAAPALQIRSANSTETIHLSDFKGKPILLHFWASWCEACKDELPELMSLSLQMKDQGVEMLAISTDRGEKQKLAQAVISAMKPSVPLYFLAEKEEAKKFISWGLPVTYLISSQGKIVARAVGRRAWNNSRDQIAKILAQGAL